MLYATARGYDLLENLNLNTATKSLIYRVSLLGGFYTLY